MSVIGLTIQHIGEQFQWSNDTISKYFHCMLGNFSTKPFYTTYINLPSGHAPLLWRICNNPKMLPFFDCALGTLNGCYITCAPPWYSCPPYRNQKGFISQNCLFACDFDLQFVFLLPQVGRVYNRCLGLRRGNKSRTWNTKWLLLPGWCGLPTIKSTPYSLPWGQVPSCQVEQV